MGNKGTAALGGIKTHIRRERSGATDTPVTIRRKVVSALIRRLRDHVLGHEKENEDGTKTRVYTAMTMTQLRAAEMLLARSVPVLSAIEMDVKGEVGHYDISDKPLGIEEWEREAQDFLETAGRPPDATH